MNTTVSQKIDDFFGTYRTKKYEKGQILIFNGDKPGKVFHLVSGRVKQYDITDSGDEIVLNAFKPPAFFPMSIAINDPLSAYTFQAETDIEVHEAPSSAVVDFLKANPDVTYDLLSRVYRGLDGVLGRMAHLMSGNARTRLIYELLIAFQRFGVTQKNGSTMLELNETELAARTGLSRETVSREMKKLARDGIVTTHYGAVSIKDPSALENQLKD